MSLENILTKIKIHILAISMFSFILVLFFIALSTLFILLEIYRGIDTTNYTSESYAYSNWIAVFISIVLFSFFVLGYITPMKKREWRTAGIYEAFIIALFTEMYGFPLTIYILSSFFGIRLSFGHIQGHLLGTMLAKMGILSMEVAWALVMILSTILMLIGFILIYRGWCEIYRSKGKLVTDGIYKYVRHPQYLGILLITIGMLVQWPTIITLAMWPILIIMYYRLAKKEEKEMEEKFGKVYIEYKRKVPMFLPLKRLIKRK